jgi:hypothetical protein
MINAANKKLKNMRPSETSLVVKRERERIRFIQGNHKSILHFKVVLLFFILFNGVNSFSQNVGVGINIAGNPPNPKALLDVDATGMSPMAGVLVPRMTTADRSLITAPIPESLMIYNTDTHCFEAYYNGGWVDFGCLATGCQLPAAPAAGTNTPSPTQIVWNWSTITGASSYQWNTTNTYPGAGVNVVTSPAYTQTSLTCNTTYTLYVWADNSCGNSTATALTQTTSTSTITISGSITGNTAICGSPAGNAYSIAATSGATTYSWTVPAGASITSGQGTTGIVVNFGTVTGSVNVCVTASNACGSSVPGCLQVTITAGPPAIGQSYQGGVVGYLLKPGDPGYSPTACHGLIAAVSDNSTGAVWSNVTGILIGTTSQGLGKGAANTAAIEGQSGYNCDTCAASICTSYTSVGYSGWYLPSENELIAFYPNYATIGGFNTITYIGYWSSSEYTYNVAWGFDYYNDFNTDATKNVKYHVRCIHSF